MGLAKEKPMPNQIRSSFLTMIRHEKFDQVGSEKYPNPHASILFATRHNEHFRYLNNKEKSRRGMTKTVHIPHGEVSQPAPKSPLLPYLTPAGRLPKKQSRQGWS